MRISFKAFAAAVICTAMAVACSEPAPKETELTVTPATLSFNANSPAAVTVSVTANKSWTAKTTADWLTISPGSGDTDGKITVTAKENVGPAGEAAAARNAEITITSEDKISTIKVNQKAETIVFVTDKTTASVPADGASVVIGVQYNTAYKVTIPAEATWISEASSKAVATANVTLSVAANDVTEPRQATVSIVPASGEAKTITITQEAKAVELVKLDCAANLKAFADAVNAREPLEKFDPDGDGVFTLEADIDLKGVAWTPIGTATYSTNPDTTKMFRGVFDGNNHTIDNLVVDLPADAVNCATAGLFGSVYASTIKNLTIGSNCVFTSKAVNQGAIGAIAGFTMNTTIDNCKVYATVNYDGGEKDDVRQSVGGFVGSFNCSSATGMENAENSALKNSTFYGKMTSKNKANTKNGGTGISLGGLIGFAECTKDADANYPNYNVVQNCVNEGTVSGEATRIAGVVASCNNGTHVVSCTNNGTISGSDLVVATSRVGGVVSTCNARTDITDCVNNGIVEFAAASTTHGYAAGIVAQMNDNTNFVDGCKNFGIVRSDIINADPASGLNYIGSIFANANKKAVAVKNCQVEGYVGPYTDYEANKIQLTKANFKTYISMAGATYNGGVVYDNNTCSVEAPVVQNITISSADEFLVFAENASAYKTGDLVTLAADITLPADTAMVIVDTLLADFIGGGHTIHYELNVGGTKDTGECGLFGVVAGKVSDLIVEGSIILAPIYDSAGAKTYRIGGIAGAAAGTAEISGCTNKVAITATTRATHQLGGIVGFTSAGCTVKNSTNEARVGMVIPDKGTAQASQVGGIIGHVENSALIQDCTNNAEVIWEGTGTPRIGGIVGYLNKITEVSLISCTNNGTVQWNEGAYTGSSWSYVGGITGYYGTPSHKCKVYYKDCVNNGAVNCVITDAKSKTRSGGIAAHAGISSTEYVENELDWTFENCTNNGAINCSSTTNNIFLAGICGFSEKTVTLTFKGCTSKGNITSAGTGRLGGITGGYGGSASSFSNVTVDPSIVLSAAAATATTTMGLLAGEGNAYTTTATGKVAGTIALKDSTVVATSDNYASILLGTKVEAGAGWDATGVTFNTVQ